MNVFMCAYGIRLYTERRDQAQRKSVSFHGFRSCRFSVSPCVMYDVFVVPAAAAAMQILYTCSFAHSFIHSPHPSTLLCSSFSSFFFLLF